MSNQSLNINGVPTILSEISYNGYPVISEVAKRDADGNKIDETYIKVADLASMLKTINNQSLIGSGNITIEGGSSSGSTTPSTPAGVSEARVNTIVDEAITSAINIYDSTISLRLNTKQGIIDANNKVSSNFIDTTGTDKLFVTAAEKAQWSANSGSGESISLMFDDLPTEGSGNAVKSSGVKSYVDTKIEGLNKELDLNTHEYFYVNGEVATPINGVITLAAQTEYTLSGYLRGHIVIDCSALIEAKDPESTTLILDNLYIESDSDEAIVYNSELKSLIIKLYEDTNNFLVYKGATVPAGLSSNAVIHSYHNLVIKGAGYLTIRTNGRTHGIKAEDINILGKPTLTIDVAYGCEQGVRGHDGIHASDTLTISNGVFDIKHANDAIGTGEQAEVNIYAGSFTLDYAEGQHALDVSSGVGRIYQNDFLSWPAGASIRNSEIITPESYGTAYITNTTNGYNTPIMIGSNGVYTLAGNNTTYEITGLIVDPIVVTGEKVGITFSNAALIMEEGDTRVALAYSPSSQFSRLAITFAEGTVNYISGEGMNVVTSNKNLHFGGKGVGYVHGLVAASEVALKGDGNKYFYVSGGENIIGTCITIGEEFDSVSLGKGAGNSKQNLYLNSELHARVSSGNKKAYVCYYANQSEDVFFGSVVTEIAPLANPHSGEYNNLLDEHLLHKGSTAISGYNYEYEYLVSELVDTISNIEDRLTTLEHSGGSGSGSIGSGLPEYPSMSEDPVGTKYMLMVEKGENGPVLKWVKLVVKSAGSGADFLDTLTVEDDFGNPVELVVADDSGNPIELEYSEN